MRAAGRWARHNLFASPMSGAVTVLLAAALVWAAWHLWGWAVLHAVWSVPVRDGRPDTAACRAASGACWAVLGTEGRFILFGSYPPAQQWRPALAVALVVALGIASGFQRFWRRPLLGAWAAVLVAGGTLMRGGVAGLPPVPEDRWGGLPVTLGLAVVGLGAAFPLAVAVALGRHSRRLPALRWLCVAYVELIRGVPLVSLLFMASVMFPLLLPPGIDVDALLRAQVAIVLFAAAYLAEVVRAGLQAVPAGQGEAADALGLSPWRRTRLVVLPQALRAVVPPLVGTFIGFFKDTSLVVVIGLYDLTMTGKLATLDPVWQGLSAPVYVAVGAIYFAFCFGMSRASRRLERLGEPA